MCNDVSVGLDSCTKSTILTGLLLLVTLQLVQGDTQSELCFGFACFASTVSAYLRHFLHLLPDVYVQSLVTAQSAGDLCHNF